MSKRMYVAAFGVVCAFLAAAGCSDDTVRGTLEPSPYHAAPVTQYFPVADGFSTQLTVTTADGGVSVLTFEIGSVTTYNYYDAYPVRTYKGSTLLATDYLVVRDSALYIFDGGASAQKMLDLPLRAGHTWMRNDLGELTPDDNPDDESGDDGDDDLSTGDDDGGVGQAPMGFPGVTGQYEMRVMSRESVILPNGQSFSNVWRIRNQNASGGYNYFWYASGVGLVKYVIDANPLSTSVGSEVGELTSYGIGLRK